MTPINGPAGHNPFTVIQGGQSAAGQPTPPPGNVHPLVPQPPPQVLPEHDPGVRKDVRRAASRHQSFESALLSMVNAAGVSGPKAEAVASAIMANEDLRAQAEAAYDQSGLRSVD